jgi:hypothetical protein
VKNWSSILVPSCSNCSRKLSWWGIQNLRISAPTLMIAQQPETHGRIEWTSGFSVQIWSRFFLPSCSHCSRKRRWGNQILAIFENRRRLCLYHKSIHNVSHPRSKQQENLIINSFMPTRQRRSPLDAPADVNDGTGRAQRWVINH